MPEVAELAPDTLCAVAGYIEREYGPRIALIHGEQSLSYSKLVADARRVGAGLAGHGVGKGTRVAIIVANSVDFVTLALGVSMCGGVLVPISTLSTPDEWLWILDHCDASVLVSQREVGRRSVADELTAELGELGSERVSTNRLPFLRTHLQVGGTDAADVIGDSTPEGAERIAARAERVTPSDDGMIIYTSGTTSRPKAVLHSQRGPTLQVFRWIDQLRLGGTAGGTDVIWSPWPYFWTAGFGIIGGALAGGATTVVQTIPEARAAHELLEKHSVTAVRVWKELGAAIRDEQVRNPRDLTALRSLAGGANELRPFAPHAQPDDGRGTSYGLSETFTHFTSQLGEFANRPATGLGWPFPGNRIRIVDPESGRAVAAGTAGEITLSGPTLMKGYYKMPRESAFDEDGYFHTGDLGFVDEDDCLHWTGRASGLIKTSGANVSPIEVEQTFDRTGRLACSVVVGVRHPVVEEAVVLVAVRRPEDPITSEDLIGLARQSLPSFKVPRRVVFVDADELARTATGKVRPDSARRLAIESIARGTDEWAQHLREYLDKAEDKTRLSPSVAN